MAKLFANSGDPDQMPHSAASDLGLHYLPLTLLLVSRLQWVNDVVLLYILFYSIVDLSFNRFKISFILHFALSNVCILYNGNNVMFWVWSETCI